MGAKKTGLGRGLDALLGDLSVETPTRAEFRDGLQTIPVDLLVRGAYQPRQDIHQESLEDLARSIRAQGVVQPIVVRPLRGDGGGGRFEIVAGERRWRAAQMAGLDAVPAVVRDIPDAAAVAVALIENIQRENLNPLEESLALRRLIDEFNLTHQEAADAVGRSRAAVSNLLRLQELGEEATALVRAGTLEMGHARALLALPMPRQQAEVAQLVARKSLSVRETERLVARMLRQGGQTAKAGPAGGTDPDVRRLQDDLSGKLGAKVSIQHSSKGRGKLVVSYNSLEELEGILQHIQ